MCIKEHVGRFFFLKEKGQKAKKGETYGASQSDPKKAQPKLPRALQTKEQREETRLQNASNFKLKLEKESRETREAESIWYYELR